MESILISDISHLPSVCFSGRKHLKNSGFHRFSIELEFSRLQISNCLQLKCFNLPYKHGSKMDHSLHFKMLTSGGVFGFYIDVWMVLSCVQLVETL